MLVAGAHELGKLATARIDTAPQLVARALPRCLPALGNRARSQRPGLRNYLPERSSGFEGTHRLRLAVDAFRLAVKVRRRVFGPESEEPVLHPEGLWRGGGRARNCTAAAPDSCRLRAPDCCSHRKRATGDR